MAQGSRYFKNRGTRESMNDWAIREDVRMRRIKATIVMEKLMRVGFG